MCLTAISFCIASQQINKKVKVKVSLCLIKHNAMNAYKDLQGQAVRVEFAFLKTTFTENGYE